ncbi:MAG: hypothetical protein ACLVEE_11715, partial [Phocaeicola vulgatus]
CVLSGRGDGPEWENYSFFSWKFLSLAARYGWADNPDCNLYGENGPPGCSFPDRLLVEGVSLNLFLLFVS